MQCRRNEDRIPAGGAGDLNWDSGSGAHQCRVAVRNISNGGVQLVSKRALQPGYSAHLRGEQFDCLGDVLYCNPYIDGYVIGMRFLAPPSFREHDSAPS